MDERRRAEIRHVLAAYGLGPRSHTGAGRGPPYLIVSSSALSAGAVKV